MIVVSDSSPLVTLAAIGQLHLLYALFGKVLIPEAVYREVAEEGAGRPGAREIGAADWIERHAVGHVAVADVLKLELDEGEAEAIALALEHNADLILLDERRGRQRAMDLGLTCTGVLGVLVEAKDQRMVERVRPLLDLLRTSAGFWMDDSLYDRVLVMAGEAS